MTIVRASIAEVVRPVRDLAEQRAGITRVSGIVALILVAVGLFTVSWDRFGNIPVAGYNVKVPALVFSAACLVGAPGLWRLRHLLRRPGVRVLAALMGAVVVVLVLAAALAADRVAAAGQLVAVASGAVLPLIAIVSVIASVEDLVWALDWFVAGAVVACAFGLYQLTAFYLGWPQLVGYSGVGLDGGGRITAFSYGPAYFANFVVLAFGAAAACAVIRGRVLGWVPVFGFAVVLVLVNVRALYFLVPALVVLMALRWRGNRRLLLRVVVAGVVAVALNIGATQLVTHLAEQTAASSGSSSSAPGTPAEERPDSSGTRADPLPGGTPATVLDPNEQSSNAPRLALYRAVLAVAADHPVLGVGPGNLRAALADDGYVAANQGAQVVANNIWLQALVDGGAVLLLLELAVVAAITILVFKRSMAPLQPLGAAVLAVLLVSGMLTSYFFDVKVWVVFAILLAARGLVESGGLTPERTPAAR